METLVTHPTPEQLRSFDPLASVNMLRFDLTRFGCVLPETKQRVCDEELSYLAEGIDRASRTAFVLRREGNDLLYFDEGSWRPYSGMLQTGLEAAKREAGQDYRRRFLVEWARRDQEYGYKLRSLKPGEQLVWTNPYPHDMEALHGKQFMQSCGLQPGRKMGFIYRAYCRPDGHVMLESQTVDGSDPEAFAAVQQAAASPHAEMDDLVEPYDKVLAQKHGEQFYAGRKRAEIGENAWRTIKAQEDLIVYFVEGLEKIAASSRYGRELEEAAKRHVYGVWATFKKRIDGTVYTILQTAARTAMPEHAVQAQLAREVSQNFSEFAKAGKVLLGCGGMLSMINESNLMTADSKDVFSAIFGKEPEDKYGSLHFKCKYGHSNRRPRNQLLEKCKVCKVSVRC